MRKMSPIPKLPLLLISAAQSDLVSELQSLQSRSKSGVIRLTDQSVSRFLTSASTPRPYSVLIFFEAAKLHEKPELHLTDLRREFGLVAESFISNNADPASPSHAKLFFCDIEFQDSQNGFAMFGVNSLPHIRLVGPGLHIIKAYRIALNGTQRLRKNICLRWRWFRIYSTLLHRSVWILDVKHEILTFLAISKKMRFTSALQYMLSGN